MDEHEAHTPPRTVAELKAEHEALQREIDERVAQEKAEVLNQIQEVARDYNITLEEIIEHFGGLKPKRKGSPAKPKYFDPVSGKTWSGRGKEPLWIRGKNRYLFLIPAEVTEET